LPRPCLVIALDGGPDGVLQLFQRLHAEPLGEVVIDLDLARGLHLLHGDIELGRLSSKVLRSVALRESDLDVALLASLSSHKLVLEAGDEGAGPEFKLHAFAIAALKGGAVDRAHKIQNQPITSGRRGALAFRREGAVLPGHPL
jgi:hypothetical protein